MQRCTFPTEIDHLIKSEFIGMLNWAINDPNNPTAPSIHRAVVATKSAFNELSLLRADDIKIGFPASFIIDPKEVYNTLLELLRNINEVKKNLWQTPEYEKNLLEQLQNTFQDKKVIKNTCKELLELSESINLEEQKVAAKIIRSLMDNPKQLDKEVAHAVISSSKNFSIALSNELLPTSEKLKDFVRKYYPNDKSLRKAALDAAISIDLNTYARIIQDNPNHFPKNLNFLLDKKLNPNTPHYRNIVHALVHVCTSYNDSDGDIAVKLISKNPSSGLDTLASALEHALTNKDPKSEQLLKIMLLMPNKRAITNHIKKVIIQHENEESSRKMLEDALNEIKKLNPIINVARGFIGSIIKK